MAARYRWWSARGGRGFAHQPDLSVAFLERALELARPGGTVSFLLPAKLATAAYAAPARGALAAHATLRMLADLGTDPRAQFEATVYPMATVVTRAAPPPEHQVRLRLGAAGGGPRQGRLGAAPWVLVPDPVARALDRVAAGHPRLSDLVECHLGAKTGLNRVFLAPPATIEPELLAWAVRGRDVSAFAVRPRRRMIWPLGDDGRPLTRLPPGAAAHFRSYATTLRRRKDWHGGPEWTVFRARPAAAPYKVVWADLATVLGAAPLTGPRSERLIPLNTCYLVPVADAATALRLAAWLNCTWIRAAAAAVADPAASGFRRFNARAVGSLPLPTAMLGDPCLDDLARDGLAGTLRQRDLDDACARHLHLSPADRLVLAALVPRPGHHRR